MKLSSQNETLRVFKTLRVYLIFLFCLPPLHAQQTIRYTGNTLVNVDYHHGQLSPVVGVHNIQVFRANREHPEMAEMAGQLTDFFLDRVVLHPKTYPPFGGERGR